MGSDPRERMKTQGVFSSTSAKTYSKQRQHGRHIACDIDLETDSLNGLWAFDVLLSTTKYLNQHVGLGITHMANGPRMYLVGCRRVFPTSTSSKIQGRMTPPSTVY